MARWFVSSLPLLQHACVPLQVFDQVLVQPRDAREASDVFYRQASNTVQMLLAVHLMAPVCAFCCWFGWLHPQAVRALVVLPLLLPKLCIAHVQPSCWCC